MPDELVAAEFRVEDHPDPLDIEVLETQIRREASAAMGLGGEADLAIFVRDAGRVVAGISGWTWGDCCELQSLWVEPSLRGRGLATGFIAAAEAAAAARGCSQTVHFTYAFQARALYERNGYELVGRVEDFPSGTDVLWYRKRLNPPESPPIRERSRSEKPSENTAALMTDPDPEARGRSTRRIELRPERCSEDEPVAVAGGVLQPVRDGQVGSVPLTGFAAVDAGVVGSGAGVAGPAGACRACRRLDGLSDRGGVSIGDPSTDVSALACRIFSTARVFSSRP